MKILLFGDAGGQINNCIAIAQACKKRGWEVLFMLAGDHVAKVEQLGFNVQVLKPDNHQSINFNEQTSSTQRDWDKSSFEQIEHVVGPYYEAIIEQAMRLNPAMQQVIDDYQPDCIVVDDVVTYPAIHNADKPWIRIVSCDETEVPDPAIAPNLSGYRNDSDQQSWWNFKKCLEQRVLKSHNRFNQFLEKHHIAPLTTGQLIHPSPYCNALLTTESVALPRKNPLDKNRYLYLNACIRETEDFTLPKFPDSVADKPLLYVSFGTMANDETTYLHSLLLAFKDQPFRVIATVGDEFVKAYSDLPDNINILGYAPQPTLIPQCDLVIFHGGNNTNNECYFNGKPVIVIPYYWDQHAVATRRQQLGHGLYLSRQQFKPEQLPKLVHTLFDDELMLSQLKAISQKMQQQPGVLQIMDNLQRLDMSLEKQINDTKSSISIKKF